MSLSLQRLAKVRQDVRIDGHRAIAASVGSAIADHVTITAMSLVTKDIREAGVYFPDNPLLANPPWHHLGSRYRALDKLALIVAKSDKSSKQ